MKQVIWSIAGVSSPIEMEKNCRCKTYSLRHCETFSFQSLWSSVAQSYMFVMTVPCCTILKHWLHSTFVFIASIEHKKNHDTENDAFGISTEEFFGAWLRLLVLAAVFATILHHSPNLFYILLDLQISLCFVLTAILPWLAFLPTTVYMFYLVQKK